uniref:mRNA-capping enzyme n=1 Tax=Aceria tosichella TaxID=561515 RepID=A0A6G1SPD1_9ACAR
MASAYASRDSPPKRWLGCPNFGEVIDGTFLPLKTLLSDDYSVPDECKFTPEIFFQQMKDRKLNVGLLINLTFSTRYYDGNEITDDHNVEYIQISCRGHKEAPQPAESNQFIRVCNKFLNEHPGKLIAVHCTHGFNRTGFMICAYLVHEREWALNAAVQEFAQKRPPGIYKGDYLLSLHDTYGDDDDEALPVPERPDWEEPLLASMGSDHHQLSQLHHQREFYEGIDDVQLVRDDALRRKIYNHCCMLLSYPTRGPNVSFPGAQPVSMDRENIHLLGAHKYRVSWKADGCRYMMYIQDEENIFFLCRNLLLWRVNNLKFPKIDDLHGHLTDTLIDGELVTDIFKGQKIPRYLIYDVIALNGVLVGNQNFDKRCGKIKCIIVEARRKAKQHNIIPREGEAFKVADKGFWFLHDARKTWDLDVTHEKDGLIFQPVDIPYKGGTCPEILKWKPPELNSIDFRLVVREERQNGCLPETMAYLHVSNKPDPIDKFVLRGDLLSYRQYHNKIVECVWNKRWEVIRERTDKVSPNSLETAIAVYKSIKQPVTEQILFDFIAKIPPEPRQPAQPQTNR